MQFEGRAAPGQGALNERRSPQRTEDPLKGFHVWVENAHDILVEVTREGVIAYVSPNVKAVLGYAPEEVLGTNVLDHVHEEDLAYARVHLAAPEGWSTCRYRHRDGSWRWMEMSARDGLAAGAPGHMWFVARDVTGRKLVEDERHELQQQLRQARKLELLGTLAGSIAHDFNNLLSGIVLNANLARQAVPDRPVARERLDDLLIAGRRASALVKQILNYSRPEKLERLPIQFQPVISEVLKLLRSLLPGGIDLRADVRDSASLVLADATAIHQVLMNLCTNAAQAMRGLSGRIEVRLDSLLVDEIYTRTHPQLRPGSYVRLMVSDAGIGMDAGKLQHLFDPFYLARGPREGTGLGLAIVQRIVTDHNGAIHVSSQPGEGTVFELFFPRYESRPFEDETKRA
jgi:PAS domain S-box-containing protein